MLKVYVQKDFGGFRLDVTLEADAGITGILGPSGCGKSMTLRCIAGVEQPDRGHIELDGLTLFDSRRRINLPPQKRQVGYLFQNYALFPNMTVEKNILCGLRLEPDREKRRQALVQAINMLQLTGLERHSPSQLSGGQAQRVALARILVSRPRLLMLDEPFSALDGHLRDDLHIQMKHLLGHYGGKVLMVTHNRDEAYYMCDDIVLMDSGVFLAHKPTRHLFADPGTVAGARMIGCKNIAAVRKTGEYEVEVPEWGLRLTTAQPVGDEVCAVAVRSPSFCESSRQNRFEIEADNEIEAPFEWLIRFRFKGQQAGSPDLWWRVPKDRSPRQTPTELGISSEDILLLYPASKLEPLAKSRCAGKCIPPSSASRPL